MFFKGKFSLAPYGDEFANSYLTVKLLDKNQISKLNKELVEASRELKDDADALDIVDGSERVMDILYRAVAEQFIEGQIFDGEGDRPMKKSDIENFPPAIIQELNKFTQGTLGKKA